VHTDKQISTNTQGNVFDGKIPDVPRVLYQRKLNGQKNVNENQKNRSFGIYFIFTDESIFLLVHHHKV
jgi:hypothetical protein